MAKKNQETMEKLVARLTAEGKTATEIAVAVSELVARNVTKQRDKQNRERNIEDGRREIRNRIFTNAKLTRAQQISLLYAFLDSNADYVRNWYVKSSFGKSDLGKSDLRKVASTPPTCEQGAE